MSSIKLFNIAKGVRELQSSQVLLEKELQNTIENNMETFFGVKFLASEYVTTNSGRMDSLGIDENGCPVIFEYKRNSNQNVINQGLYYLNWLEDHKDSFKLLVIDRLGSKVAKNIDWSMARLICVANDFNKYDENAIAEINKNISLIRYKKFDNNLLLFEGLGEQTALSKTSSNTQTCYYKNKNVATMLKSADKDIKILYENIRSYIMDLGDDITENELKLYVAFRKIKNIICMVVVKSKIILYVKIDPKTVKMEAGFTRSLINKNHWGTGNLEVVVKDRESFEKAKILLNRAYQEN
jgi:predicted transport protein